MTQAEMEREVARTTGESICTVRSRGFSLLVMPERDPLVVDWDHVQEHDPSRYPLRRRPVRRHVAA
ncbi:MAG: hypothetical protein QM775_09600 [Pirellulales bacterium]